MHEFSASDGEILRRECICGRPLKKEGLFLAHLCPSAHEVSNPRLKESRGFFNSPPAGTKSAGISGKRKGESNMMHLKNMLLSAALAALLVAAGCSAASTGTPSGAGGSSELTLRVGTTASADGFNAMTENGSFGKLNYTGLCAAPFVTTDEKGEVQPYMMTSWEISDDKNTLTATFATDKGVTWHDGEPVTMDDVLFTFRYQIQKKSGYCTGLTAVEKIDDTTAKLTFEDGKAFNALNSMANFVKLSPKHVWEKVDGDYKEYQGEDASIGCGPFRMTGYDPEAQVITYQSVGEYFMGTPAFDKVTVKTYDSHDALVMALRTGEIDAMYDYSNSLSATMAPSVTGVENLNPGMSDNPGNYQLVFGFNQKPTDDLAFRKAVRSALDYELLRTSIGGEDGQIPGTGIVAPPNKGFDPSLPKLSQDQEAAKAILEEGGYLDKDGDGFRELPDGSEMNVLITPQYNKTRQPLYLRIAEILKANLEEVGIRTTLDEESVRNADHATQVRKEGTYQLYIGYTSPGVAMYDTAFMYIIQNDSNPWGTCTLPAFVAAYEAKQQGRSYEEYSAAMKDLQAIADQEVIGLALCWDKAYFPYRTDRFEGFTNIPGWGVINNKTWFSVRPKNA